MRENPEFLKPVSLNAVDCMSVTESLPLGLMLFRTWNKWVKSELLT